MSAVYLDAINKDETAGLRYALVKESVRVEYWKRHFLKSYKHDYYKLMFKKTCRCCVEKIALFSSEAYFGKKIWERDIQVDITLAE